MPTNLDGRKVRIIRSENYPKAIGSVGVAHVAAQGAAQKDGSVDTQHKHYRIQPEPKSFFPGWQTAVFSEKELEVVTK